MNGVEGMSLIQSDVEKAATWETLLKTQTFKITAVLQQEALNGSSRVLLRRTGATAKTVIWPTAYCPDILNYVGRERLPRTLTQREPDTQL